MLHPAYRPESSISDICEVVLIAWMTFFYCEGGSVTLFGQNSADIGTVA